MTNDLTRGKPAKLILLFSLPLLIGNIFQQLYSMVDTLIVGRTLGFSSLAGVGATGAISFLVLGFVSGLTGGFAVITAQYFGAKDEDNVRRSVATSFLLCIVLGAVLTVVSVTTTMPLLKLMRTPPDIIGDAYNYIITIYFGLFAVVFYNMVASILRALGDSKTPLIFLIIASVINVGLDILFIVVFKMGVAGAGWATVISQAASGAACLVFMIVKYPILRLKKRDWRFSWSFAFKHLRLALPMAFQFSITAIGVIILQSALNTLGTTAVGSYTAASKIDTLATQTLMALGTAMATYVGQNYGAGEYGRIRKGVRAGAVISVIFSVAGFALVLLLGRPLTSLFVKDVTEEIQVLSRQYLLVNGGCYIVLGLLFVYRNALQGMGRGALTMLAGLAELIMRAIAALVFVRFWGYLGACWSSPVAWMGAIVLLLLMYYLLIRKYPAISGGSPVEESPSGMAENTSVPSVSPQENQIGDSVASDGRIEENQIGDSTVNDGQVEDGFGENSPALTVNQPENQTS